jgi:hypothetical protein
MCVVVLGTGLGGSQLVMRVAASIRGRILRVVERRRGKEGSYFSRAVFAVLKVCSSVLKKGTRVASLLSEMRGFFPFISFKVRMTGKYRRGAKEEVASLMEGLGMVNVLRRSR